MARFQPRARRLLFAGGFAFAIACAPAVVAFTVLPTADASPRTADNGCPGQVSIGLVQVGAPIAQNCGPGVAPAPVGGGAPSEGTLSGCSGVPGCLSNALYGPGNVQVPNVDTTVHQSQ
jgi:hypothetical protein